ncbi:MAG: SIS domain-containing protein [Verrucomicrobiota bacterium]
MSSGAASDSIFEDPESFLKIAADFHLGDLMTEAQHPDTMDLSYLAKNDLRAAIELLKQVDLDALKALRDLSDSLISLAEEIRSTLAAGQRIFLCGCGATGRLSLSLEIFARSGQLGESLADDQIIGFMAGGDAALIRSIESFEDFSRYGARQLMDLGFSEGDLLISTTEGGETPFVIGATQAAAGLKGEAARAPYFLYCNPDGILCKVAERSRQVIEAQEVRSLSLPVGPMALSGSTRMQASTVLMAAVGWAMLHRSHSGRIRGEVEKFIDQVKGVDFFHLEGFIAAESEAYQSGKRVLYQPASHYGITVMTDTTERAPTFSLRPFQNNRDPDDLPCLCYLHLMDTATAGEAWHQLLLRDPRPLEWQGVKSLAGKERMMGFDFSDHWLETFLQQGQADEYLRFEISDDESFLRLKLADAAEHSFAVESLSPFARQLLLKLMLNIHSTLVMGRLARYEDNLMTYVSASNNKLLDRAVRYVQMLLHRRLPKDVAVPDYESICRELFRQKTRLLADESVVIKTMEAFL